MRQHLQRAAAVSILPLRGDFDTVGIEVEGTPYPPGEQPYPERYIVTPDYFKLMQIRLLRGRFLAESDNETAPLVALVTDTAAQRRRPGQDPVSKRIQLPGFTPEMTKMRRTGAGVVHGVKQAGLDALPTMQIHVPQAGGRRVRNPSPYGGSAHRRDRNPNGFGRRQPDLLTLVVRQGAELAAWGLLAGVADALLLTRFLSRLLLEVSPFDPATFLGAAVLLGCLSPVGIYIPARRAANLDPMITLRYE